MAWLISRLDGQRPCSRCIRRGLADACRKVAHEGLIPSEVLRGGSNPGDINSTSQTNPFSSFVSPSLIPPSSSAPLDSSSSTLFNFNPEALNFGDPYGALEFSMLGHMSSGQTDTPPKGSPFSQYGSPFAYTIGTSTSSPSVHTRDSGYHSVSRSDHPSHPKQSARQQTFPELSLTYVNDSKIIFKDQGRPRTDIDELQHMPTDGNSLRPSVAVSASDYSLPPQELDFSDAGSLTDRHEDYTNYFTDQLLVTLEKGFEGYDPEEQVQAVSTIRNGLPKMLEEFGIRIAHQGDSQLDRDLMYVACKSSK